MDKLCTYEKCEGYDMAYVWFHNCIYKGFAYKIGVLWIFSGEVRFYRTYDDYDIGIDEARARIFPVITGMSLNYTHGYSRTLRPGEWEAYRIQKAWRRIISDPSYKMCRTRLMREFCDLGQSQDFGQL